MMSTRRKKQRQEHTVQGFRDDEDVHRCSSSVDRLAFRYMEMCKVESSTDSGSDTSPRWSDTSIKSCVSTRHKSGIPRKTPTLVQKPPGRHLVAILDPYDGSSEDSELSDGGSRMQRQGVVRLRGRGRRGTANSTSFLREKYVARPTMAVPPSMDVHMRSSSDTEARLTEPGLPSSRTVTLQTGVEKVAETGGHTGSPPCVPRPADVGTSPLGFSSSRSCQAGIYRLPLKSHEESSYFGSFPKRKSCLPGAEVAERDLRKRQRVVEMEVGHLSL